MEKKMESTVFMESCYVGLCKHYVGIISVSVASYNMRSYRYYVGIICYILRVYVGTTERIPLLTRSY